MAAMHETAGGPDAGHGDEHSHHHDDHDGRPRLAFIGAGQVGTALGVAFHRAGWEVTAVASRGAEGRARFAEMIPGVRAFAEPPAVLDEADLILLTVPDDAVPPLAASLKLYSGQGLVHTSGALPASVLAPAMAAGTSSASFHPLVAFADLERALRDLVGATVALEGDESLLPVLAELAESVGAQPVALPGEAKGAYHAAAMLAAGGITGLLDAIVDLASVAGLDEATALSVYSPLVGQALANAQELGVERALTGPFLRGDVGTVRAHLEALERYAPGALPLYTAVARRELAIARRRGALAPEREAELERLLDRH